MSDPGEDLAKRLREGGEDELLQLLGEIGDELEVGAARQVLRNPFATSRVIELLLDQQRLLRSSELRRELVAHPQTPEVRALRLVPTLYWRDLVQIGGNSRVKPAIRRAADRALGDRLAGLAVGEKMAIARRAGAGLIARLRTDPSHRVIAALLENPRLTEPLLAPLLSGELVRPAILSLIARDRRWGSRYGVRLAICRNPRTPTDLALGLLSSLRKIDLKTVAEDSRLSAAVRRRADLLRGHST